MLSLRIVAFYVFCTSCTLAKLPNYIKVCKRSEPNIDSCIMDSIMRLKPQLIEGIPELDVPSIEPFRLNEIRLKNNVNCNITNISAYGASTFKLLELKSQIEKNRFAALVHIDHINLLGDYVMNAKFLTIPLIGSGPMTVNLTDIKVALKLKAHRTIKEGATYMRFEPIKIKLAVEGQEKIDLKGLFKDQPTLARAATTVIEDNASLFVSEVIPQVETNLGFFFRDIANKITLHFTFEELFP